MARLYVVPVVGDYVCLTRFGGVLCFPGSRFDVGSVIVDCVNDVLSEFGVEGVESLREVVVIEGFGDVDVDYARKAVVNPPRVGLHFVFMGEFDRVPSPHFPDHEVSVYVLCLCREVSGELIRYGFREILDRFQDLSIEPWSLLLLKVLRAGYVPKSWLRVLR
ncbi:MAG: hypothetical protein DRJ40_05605 [Thermoprotei archaeon]|nr:MAG: hypothetical protein DRJ40_05605 [Thermoprotei archaeon]